MILSSLATDLGLLLVALAGALALRPGLLSEINPDVGTHVLTMAAGVLVLNGASGFYAPHERIDAGAALLRAILVLAVALPLVWFGMGLVPLRPDHRLPLQWAGVIGAAFVVVRRLYVLRWGAGGRSRTRVLVFGAGPAARLVGETLATADPSAEIVGYLPGPNETEPAVAADRLLPAHLSLTETAHRLEVHEIIVALTERRAGSMPLRELLDCRLTGVKVYDLATHFENRLGQLRISFVNAGWLIFGGGFNQGAWRMGVKRVFDVVCSLGLLLLSAPVMLLTALLIKLDSRGPVLYRQERTGQHGRSFMIAKFRSMRTDAEGDGKPRWASSNDDRVTRVGHWIRRLRIDELPQLFNVLRGDMSLVGPRPERPFFVEQLTQEIPYYAVRHSVKPGVTGWAQVRFQYGATVEDSQQKLQYDLYYVKNHTLVLDVQILLETVMVVLTGKGAR